MDLSGVYSSDRSYEMARLQWGHAIVFIITQPPFDFPGDHSSPLRATASRVCGVSRSLAADCASSSPTLGKGRSRLRVEALRLPLLQRPNNGQVFHAVDAGLGNELAAWANSPGDATMPAVAHRVPRAGEPYAPAVGACVWRLNQHCHVSHSGAYHTVAVGDPMTLHRSDFDQAVRYLR